MPNAPGWSKDDDDRLIASWREHKSFAQIPWEFPGRTRNACIGRLHRLRKRLGTDMVPEGKSVKPRGTRKKRQRPSYSAKRQKFEPVEPTPVADPVITPEAIGKPLFELGPRDCRYIITGMDSREHLYCAVQSRLADNIGNNCYCDYHARIMWAVPPRR